mgnify:CR=1 FL=1
MNSAKVTITHQEYQALLKRQRLIPLANLSLAEKRSLNRARREMSNGNFATLEVLKNELAGKHRK